MRYWEQLDELNAERRDEGRIFTVPWLVAAAFGGGLWFWTIGAVVDLIFR